MTTGTRSGRGLRARTPRARTRLVWVGAVAGAVVFGLLAAMDPVLALAGAAMLGIIAVVLPRGELAVGAFAAATYFETLTAPGTTITPVKVLGGVVVIAAMLGMLVMNRRGERIAIPHHPFVVVASIALVAWGLASASWAVEVGQVRTLVERLLTDVLVFLAVPLLIRRPRDLRSLGWCIAVAALLGLAAGVATGTGYGFRTTGMFADPNEFAAATVVAAIFAIALGESSEHATVRWLGRAAACACMVGVVASASRSGVLAAVLAFLVLLATARGTERIRLAGILCIGIAAASIWAFATPAGTDAVKRLVSEDSTGRTDLWRVASYQFEDQPLHGVGLGNYPVVSIRYLRRDVGNLDLFVRDPRTVHNTPLELLAELGVVGFVLFYSLVVSCLVAIVRALRRARALDDPQLVASCRGVLAGLVAMLAASMTLSGLYAEIQWILLGACVAAASITRRHLALGSVPAPVTTR